jgi:hypothetical protein
MTGLPNLTGQDDVYGLPHGANGGDCAILKAGIRVTVERSPTALAQVFGLLCTFSIVPKAVGSDPSDEDFFTLSLAFEKIHYDKFELLNRKLSQMTETINVSQWLA